jgi:iron complex transport system permease protein
MNKKILLLPVLIIILILISIFCLALGGTKIPLKDTFYALFHPYVTDGFQTIIWQIRIPRILLGIIVGAGLAASGCVFQGILRNPLADPYTLGVSGGAAFGASIGIILGLGAYTLPAAGFLGALGCIFLVYTIASRKYFSIATLILAGVVLSFLFGALVLLMFALLSTDRIHSVLMWLMGDLSSTEFRLTKVVGFFVIAAIIFLYFFSSEIDILTLGEEKATHLGVDTQKTLKILFVVSSLIAGVCVSASGIIGFVGLIIPHFMRRFTGPGHGILIPASALGGAIFLSLADTAARTIIYPVELPVGVITGIFGGTVFLIFLLRTKKWEIF